MSRSLCALTMSVAIQTDQHSVKFLLTGNSIHEYSLLRKQIL